MRLPKVGKNIRRQCLECPSRLLQVLDIEHGKIYVRCEKCGQVYTIKVKS